jgi:hypothetical protein
MTGRPAETWRKFNFATPPRWAYALLILVCLGGLGFIAFAITMALIAQRATGYLPLTRSSSRIVGLAFWIPVGLLIAVPVSWLVALSLAAASNNNPVLSTIAAVLALLGVFLLITGLVGRLVIGPLITPRARVMEQAPGYNDRIVELRNVHPAFVTAVRQLQQTRAPQLAYAPQSPYLPGSK